MRCCNFMRKRTCLHVIVQLVHYQTILDSSSSYEPVSKLNAMWFFKTWFCVDIVFHTNGVARQNASWTLHLNFVQGSNKSLRWHTVGDEGYRSSRSARISFQCAARNIDIGSLRRTNLQSVIDRLRYSILQLACINL